MITKFSQFDQNTLFNLEKHLNNSNVFDTFYRLNSFNLKVIKVH
jgi:hypothetical protein